MQLAELARQGRAPALPLQVELDADALVLKRWLRVLPGQRYVGVAEYQGRKVLAKLLVGAKALRHYERECLGAQRLSAAAVGSPQLLANGFSAGQGGWLLFEFLDEAESLWTAWQSVAAEPYLSEAQQQVLADALGAIAGLHLQGLWQADLHLDNLLRHAGAVRVVDGGGVEQEVLGQPLSRPRVLENLGVFFAQLPADLEPYLEELLIHYLLANGEHALPLEQLQAQIAKVRRWRLRDYLKKLARDCSLFSAKIGAFGLRVCRRDVLPWLAPALNDPDALLVSGKQLKGGGTATVAQVELAGRTLLVKRYNIKGPLHWLKRFWRPSRAWHSWVEGNRLDFLGFTTPKPLAVIESRWFWLRGRAWLITDYLEAQDIIARFAPKLDGQLSPEELQALLDLFQRLRRERVSHGDLKGHNLFWDNGRCSLIDLDAVQQHRFQASFERAYARDRARFLRNWPASSGLYQLLDEHLPASPSVAARQDFE